MPGSSYRRRRSALRLLLLGAAGVTLLSVAGLYWLGRPPAPVRLEAPPAAETGGARVVSSGFDYTVSHEEQPLFRIRGATVRSDAEDKVTLDEVGLTLFRAGGEVYELTGRSAVYDRRTNSALVSGGARLVGPSGITLETEALELEPGGRRVRSDAPVRFHLGPSYRGQAERLDADLRSETFLFAGGVRVTGQFETGPRVTLQCKRMVIDRSTGTLHAESDVRLTRGGDVLQSRRLSLQLTDDQRQVAFVRARWEVVGRFVVGGGDAEGDDGVLAAPADGAPLDAAADAAPAGGGVERVRVRGTGLSLTLRDGKPDRLELEGPGRRPARLLGVAADGAETSIEGLLIVGRFDGGEIVAVEAADEVELVERPAPEAEPRRRASARRADASLRQGQLIAASLHGDVELAQPDFTGRGDVAFLDARAGRAELQGAPARAKSSRGEVEAPRISYRQAEGLLQAEDGVRVTLPRQSAAVPLAGQTAGEEPLRVEADQATFVEAQRTFAFLGKVRAWRGNDLLLADELRGDETSGTVAARGAVRTVWRPAGGGPSGAQAPVEVVSQALLHRRQQGTAVFTGQVEARQSGRVLRCDEATLQLDVASNELRRLDCVGRTSIEEAALGRTASGDTATYDVAGGTVVVRGEPVTLADRQRGTAQGRAVHYDLASGRIRLSARADEAAPAPDLPGNP